MRWRADFEIDLFASDENATKSIVVIGGGVIGCEFASLFLALGTKVTVLEMLPKILSTECQSVSEALTFAFKQKGMVIHTGVTVEGISKTDRGGKS